MIRRTVTALALGTLVGAFAQAGEAPCNAPDGGCGLPEARGKLLPGGRVLPAWDVPPNAEAALPDPFHGECATDRSYAMRISVDGEPIHGGCLPIAADAQRKTDLALSRADIHIRYDGFEQTPWLNVQAAPAEPAAGGAVRFATYSNYVNWIDRAEIRIFEEDQTRRQTPLAVVSVKIGGEARWTAPEPAGVYRYVLRVYDKSGRFDETRPKTLDPTHLAKKDAPVDLLAGYGEDSRQIANIPVKGGAVTVNGSHIRSGQQVRVMGMPVPVDKTGHFAVRQILPVGPQQVEVTVADAKGTVAEFSRDINIAKDDWFYIGLADFTLGKNHTTGPAKLVTVDKTDHYDDKVYLDGRLAFYLKGKIKGEYLITAAADTREQPIGDLFSNFASKDPRYLLRRLDAERYYPVYGDDSTTLEDAPTQGKFYVRVERGDSRVLWGNFHTRINGTEFGQYNRGLYGAQVRLKSNDSTAFGERRGNLEAFAADPGSLPARDEFRGTGGSLYYLRRQDITQGSERVWIETRDKDTGLVLETKYLAPAQDYDINYLQGRIVLRAPLASTDSGGGLVRTGSFSGNQKYLVATYEYTPGLKAADDMVRGGRADYWISDNVNLGLTGYRQHAPGMSQRLLGADATLRYKPGTYLKLEGARSKGPGSGSAASIDGGFRFSNLTSPGGEADARRIEGAVDLAEVSDAKGRASAYWQKKDRGFSAPGQITGSDDTTQEGAKLDWEMTEATRLALKADRRKAGDRDLKSGEVDLSHTLNGEWTVAAGLRADSRTVGVPTASDTLNEEGSRTDLVLRGDYAPSVEEGEAEWSAYGYLQGTLHRNGSRSRNNRIGLGGKRRLSERFTLNGEISGGDGGLGALVGGDYRYDDRSSLYLNYLLDSDRSDIGYRGRRGLLTTGGRTRFGDNMSVFGEERLQHGDGPSGLTHAFGLELAPTEHLNYGFAVEAGRLSDPDVGDMDRRAISFSLGYSKDDIKYAGNLEYRDEDGDASDRTTWLMRNTLGYQTTPDWRLIGRLNVSFSDASQGNFFDGDYVEFVTGYAYRPVDNDRLNLLFKYTYFYNLPSPGQLTDADGLADYAQRSHIFSVDGMYDVRPWVSLGGKYAYRLGQLRENRTGGDWFDSKTQLLIGRADFHWIHAWDLLAEARYLDVDAADDSRFGWLLGAYRHVNDSVKVGVGYNFTDFSDDLTDLSFHSRGWFFNVIGKL